MFRRNERVHLRAQLRLGDRTPLRGALNAISMQCTTTDVKMQEYDREGSREPDLEAARSAHAPLAFIPGLVEGRTVLDIRKRTFLVNVPRFDDGIA